MPGNLVVEHTLDEAVTLGQKRPIDKGQKLDSSREIDDGEWRGTRTWEEAVGLAQNGWGEGVKRLSDLRDSLYDEVGRILPEPTPMMDVSGYEVDVGAWVSGEPEHMVTMMDMEGTSRQLRITVNVCNNSQVSAEAMMMRGLLAAGLVDTLEHMGHRVELDAVCFIDAYGNGKWTHVTHVKRAQDALDLERTVFTLAHPSMLRRIVFGVMENQPAAWRHAYGQAYGQARDNPKVFLPPHLQPDLYLGNAEAKQRNMAEMVERVFQYMREGGILRDD